MKYTHELLLGYHSQKQLASLLDEFKEHKEHKGWWVLAYFVVPQAVLIALDTRGQAEPWLKDTLGTILAIASKCDVIKLEGFRKDQEPQVIEELQVVYRLKDEDFTILASGIACKYRGGLEILDR